jgi:hypothetical protein
MYMEPPVNAVELPVPPVTGNVKLVALATLIKKLPLPPFPDHPVDVIEVPGTNP